MKKQHSLKYIELDKENNGNFYSHSESLKKITLNSLFFCFVIV